MATRPKPQLSDLDKHLIKGAMEVEKLLESVSGEIWDDARCGDFRVDILKRNRRELRAHPGDKALQEQMAKNIAVFLHYVRTR